MIDLMYTLKFVLVKPVNIMLTQAAGHQSVPAKSNHVQFRLFCLCLYSDIFIYHTGFNSA